MKDVTSSADVYVAARPANQLESDALGNARTFFEAAGQVSRIAALDINGVINPIHLPKLQVPGDPILDEFRQQLRDLPGLRGVALIMEAWGVRLPPGKKRSDLPAKLEDATPEQGRMEVVTVSVEHRDFPGRTRLWKADITRDAEGKPSLGPWLLTVAEVRGEATGLLPNNGRTNSPGGSA